MFTKQQKRQLDIRSWAQFTVPYKMLDGTKITMREMRAWCKRNLVGDYRLEEIKRDGVFVDKQVRLGVIARISQDEDQVLFKLRWHDFK